MTPGERRTGRATPAVAVTSALVAVLLVGGCTSTPPDDAPSGGPGTPATTGLSPAPAATTPAAGKPKPSTQSAPKRRRYHRTDEQPYRFENSFRGIDYAVAHDYKWIDIDSQYCLDETGRRRIPIATHWRKIDTEGFDAAGRYSKGTRWADLTWSQCAELATSDEPPFTVHRMVDMVRYAAKAGLKGIEWEVKSGVGFERPSTYRRVLALARKLGVKIEVKTLHGLGGPNAAFKRLRAAKRAGARTMLINPRKKKVVIRPDQERYVDVVRGPWKRA